MNAAEKPELKPANDNPWYWLATLYGEWNPSSKDGREIAVKNRIAWNRWFSSFLSDERRQELLTKGFSPEELEPLTPTEETNLTVEFVVRSRHGNSPLPDPTKKPNFTHVHFVNGVSFNKFLFTTGVDFESATFSERADFADSTFSREANFESATFSREAYFGLATFSESANFYSARFSGLAHFSSATFSDGANFESARFSGDANFKLARFSWTIDFINSEFTAKTIFAQAHFSLEVPDFRGAKLHEATEWHGVCWPSAPQDKRTAQNQVYAYERLKQEMERLKKHEDEQFFFCKELRARRELVPFWTAAWWFNTLYAALSDYGQSTSKPLLWLCGLFLLVSDVFVWVPEITGTSMTLPQAASLSFASIFAIFPMPKGLMAPDVFDSLLCLAKIIVVVAAFFGTLLLFLLGVALRNRFRMR